MGRDEQVVIRVEAPQILALLVRQPGIGDERRQVLLAKQLLTARPLREHGKRGLGDLRMGSPRLHPLDARAEQEKGEKQAGASQPTAVVSGRTVSHLWVSLPCRVHRATTHRHPVSRRGCGRSPDPGNGRGMVPCSPSAGALLPHPAVSA